MSSAPVPHPQIKHQNQTRTSGAGPLAGQKASGRFQSHLSLPELRWAAGTLTKGPRETVPHLTAGSRAPGSEPAGIPSSCQARQPGPPPPGRAPGAAGLSLTGTCSPGKPRAGPGGAVQGPTVARIPARPWACSAASPRLWSWKLGLWGLPGHFLSLWIHHWRFKKERRGEKR